MEQQACKMVQHLIPINQKYKSDVLPYQLLVQTLSLQNQQIHILEEQYYKLQSQLNTIRESNTTINNSSLENRKNKRIIQRKMLMQQALQFYQNDYQKNYRKRQSQLKQEIEQKIFAVVDTKGDSTNIFVNFSQGFLDDLLDENKSISQKQMKDVKYWKNTYQQKKSQNQVSSQIYNN